ncbi:FUSC family protein [Streptomyces chiangmaiensis]
MDRYLTAGQQPRPDTQIGGLLRAFRLAIGLAEAVTTLQWEARPLPAAVTGVPVLMGARLLPGRKDGTVPVLPDFEPSSPGLRALAHLCATAEAERTDDVALPVPAPSRPGPAAHLRYAALLAVCVLVAQLCAEALHGPRSYWLPMTVAFVYKPDFGPVFRRALHRCVGTVVGVASIGAVSLLTHSTYALIGVVALFGALMAVGVRHHYALATTGLTAVVFVLVDLLGDHRALYGPRILDTALAAAIVLVLHFAVWPGSAAGRANTRTEAALAAAVRGIPHPATGAPAIHGARAERDGRRSRIDRDRLVTGTTLMCPRQARPVEPSPNPPMHDKGECFHQSAGIGHTCRRPACADPSAGPDRRRSERPESACPVDVRTPV